MQITDMLNQYNRNIANGTEISGGTQGIRQITSSLQQMSVGNVFEGSINHLENGVATLGLPDGKTIQARLDSGVSVRVGESMFFQVRSNNGMQIEIRPFSQAGGLNPALLNALKAAGLPADGKMVTMVNSMMEQSMPIDRQSLMQMAKLVAGNGRMDAATVVQMAKLGIPVTEEMAAQFENYKSDQYAILDRLESIMEEIPGRLAQGGQSLKELLDFNQQMIKALLSGAQDADGRVTVNEGGPAGLQPGAGTAGDPGILPGEAAGTGVQPGGAGVQAEGAIGAGVQAEGAAGQGMQAEGAIGAGVQAEGAAGAGVQPESTAGTGAQAENAAGTGVQAEGAAGAGVQPESVAGAGVQPESAAGTGVQPENAVGAGIQPEGAEAGVQPEGAAGAGVQPESAAGGQAAQLGKEPAGEQAAQPGRGQGAQTAGGVQSGMQAADGMGAQAAGKAGAQSGVQTAGEDKTAHPAQTGGAAGLGNEKAAVPDAWPDTLLKNLFTGEELQHLSSRLAKIPELSQDPSVFADKMLSSDLTSKELLQLLGQAFSSKNPFSRQALSELASSKEYRALIRNVMEQQWLLRPEELKGEHKVSELYERLDRQMAQMEKVLKAFGQSTPQLSDTAANVRSNIQFMNQLNQTYAYVQIPLKLAGQNAHSDLYVYTDKRKKREAGDELTAFLHLDLDHLGSTDVSIKLRNRQVATSFYLADNISYQILSEHIELLEKRLLEKGYQAKIHITNQEEKVNFVEDILKQGTPSAGGMVHRYSFDVRA